VKVSARTTVFVINGSFFFIIFYFSLFLHSVKFEMSYRNDGVTVEIFAAGDGNNYPKKGNTVVVHYTGSLKDGTIWDSSRDRGKPFKFKLGADQVIPGLDQGVAQLSLGERAKMTIPSHLAYGDKGFPGLIPPRSDLIFDIELISFT
jgi:FK506-binding protein 1